VFLNCDRLERVELGVQHVLESSSPWSGSECEIERRVSTQKCL